MQADLAHEAGAVDAPWDTHYTKGLALSAKGKTEQAVEQVILNQVKSKKVKVKWVTV